MRYLAAFIIFLILGGCGYIPSAKFARAVLGEKVYASVDILASDPENAVIIKNVLNEALISRFRVSLTNKKDSITQLHVSIASLRFSEIEKDSNGYAIAKRAIISLAITRTRGKESKRYSVVGSYDFDIDPNGVVSDAKRFDAIKFASLRALESLFSKIAVEGVK